MDETRHHTHDDATRASTPDPSSRLTPIPDRIGPYKVLSKLGEGGMGVVYEAEQQSPRRHVAVKVIRGGRFVDDAQLRMFQREAETLGRLKHPGIGAIYESGRTEDGQHYFAMELVRGRTLGAYLRERVPDGALTPDEVRFRLELFRSIADAVHYAHQRGVIHRDLKPSNIVVTETPAGDSSTRGGLPEVKILDFGLARITDADVQASLVSEVGSVKGTLPYMSPEQARGNPAEIDVRTDVYSLGVILYEMLARRLPREIPTNSMLEALRVIAEAPPRPLREAFRGTKRLDPDVETLCHKALERDADARYASAAAFSEDVERYLSSQPIQARPPSTLYQLKKLVKRNKLPTAFAATVVLLLVGLAVTMGVLRGQAEHARAEAQARADELERASGFMSSMLTSVDPVRMGKDLRKDLDDRIAVAGTLDGVNLVDVSRDLVAREMFARSDSLIGEQLSGDPALAARLYLTVGEAYTWGLLLYEPGIETLRKAAAAARRASGDEGEATLEADLELANALKRNGNYDESLEILERCLAIRTRTLDRDDPRVLQLELERADALRYLRHDEEAEAALRELIPRLRRVFGNDDWQVYSALNNLALAIRFDREKQPEAEQLYREAAEGAERLLGPGDPSTINIRQNLGRLIAFRDPEEGIPYLQDLLEVERKNVGDESELTLQTLQVLGQALRRVGRMEEALEVTTELLRAERSVRGLTPLAASTAIAREGCLRALGRHAEAEQALLELEGWLGDHPAPELARPRQIVLYNLACTAALRGERDEGLGRLRAAVDAGFQEADAMTGDPDLASLHGPEFDALVERARAAATEE